MISLLGVGLGVGGWQLAQAMPDLAPIANIGGAVAMSGCFILDWWIRVPKREAATEALHKAQAEAMAAKEAEHDAAIAALNEKLQATLTGHAAAVLDLVVRHAGELKEERRLAQERLEAVVTAQRVQRDADVGQWERVFESTVAKFAEGRAAA